MPWRRLMGMFWVCRHAVQKWGRGLQVAFFHSSLFDFPKVVFFTFFALSCNLHRWRRRQGRFCPENLAVFKPAWAGKNEGKQGSFCTTCDRCWSENGQIGCRAIGGVRLNTFQDMGCPGGDRSGGSSGCSLCLEDLEKFWVENANRPF